MKLLELFFRINPYEGFDHNEFNLDLQGWGSKDPNFRDLINELEPKLIVEVGSWKGGSAVFMAEYLKKLDLNCQIICVDTWLGAMEFLVDHDDPERYMSLVVKNGYPTVYYQFLANVTIKGLQEYIVPLPQTSLIACRLLKHHGIKSEMIYVDASHDEIDVFNDVFSYWEVLKDGGAIFGDDYNTWPGVKAAIDSFCNYFDVELDIVSEGRQWVIRKKSDLFLSENLTKDLIKQKSFIEEELSKTRNEYDSLENEFQNKMLSLKEQLFDKDEILDHKEKLIEDMVARTEFLTSEVVDFKSKFIAASKEIENRDAVIANMERSRFWKLRKLIINILGYEK